MNQNRIKVGNFEYRAVENAAEFGRYASCQQCAGFTNQGQLCNTFNSIAPCTMEQRKDGREVYWERIEPTYGQTKLMSMLEAVVSTFVGLLVAFFAMRFFYEWFNIPVSNTQNAIITFWMTLVSIARGFGLRRFFNWVHHR